MSPLPGKTKLAAGMPAPTFDATDTMGNRVASEMYKNKYVLLAFMRYAGCPFCNLAIHRLSLEYDRFKDNGCEIVTFMQSSPENIQKYIYDRHALRPQFPIVPDPDNKLYDLYDVQASPLSYPKSLLKVPAWLHSVQKHGFKQGSVDASMFTVPAYFLVNGRTGEIVKADYGSSFYDHETFIDLYESIFFKPLLSLDTKSFPNKTI